MSDKIALILNEYDLMLKDYLTTFENNYQNTVEFQMNVLLETMSRNNRNASGFLGRLEEIKSLSYNTPKALVENNETNQKD